MLVCLAAMSLLGTADSPLWSRSYPAADDALGGVRAWQELAERQDTFRILVVEPFEDGPYRPYAPSTELADLRYLHQSSEDEAFRLESTLTGQERTNGRSLLVMTSFNVPGRQNFQIRPVEPIRIEGQPFRLSVWVRSQEYNHRLEFLFRNADGQLIRVDGGRLFWKGWRRLDIALPSELHRMGRRIRHPTGALFEGLVIYSHPNAEPGAVSLQFDQLLMLSDFSGLRYPGAEVVDEW